jgi:hypothetical protein
MASVPIYYPASAMDFALEILSGVLLEVVNQDSHRLDSFKHYKLAGFNYNDGSLSFN